MKNREVKYPVVLILCCFIAAISSCSSHSFRSKKHQRKNFLGEKKKQEAYLSFDSNDSIKIIDFKYDKRNTEASIKTEIESFSNEIELSPSKKNQEIKNKISLFGTKSIKIKAETYKKELPPDEKKARIYERGSRRFFWLFFIVITITLIASIALLEYFILPFIGGVVLLTVPLILHSIFSQNVIKFSNNDKIKKKARTNFWVLLGIYLLLAIALLIVCTLLFV